MMSALTSRQAFIFLAGAVLCSGCTTPAPTYRFEGGPSDPKVSFASDFELHIHFSVNGNVNDAARNSCAEFDSVGYLLNKDSAFLYDKANTNISIQVPAGKPVAVMALHTYSDPAYGANCGPLTRVFTPVRDTNYVVKLNVAGKVCFLTVASVDAGGQQAPVRSTPAPKCSGSRSS